MFGPFSKLARRGEHLLEVINFARKACGLPQARGDDRLDDTLAETVTALRERPRIREANWKELERVREQFIRAGVDVTAKIPPAVLIDLLVDLNERLKKLEARE